MSVCWMVRGRLVDLSRFPKNAVNLHFYAPIGALVLLELFFIDLVAFEFTFNINYDTVQERSYSRYPFRQSVDSRNFDRELWNLTPMTFFKAPEDIPEFQPAAPKIRRLGPEIQLNGAALPGFDPCRPPPNMAKEITEGRSKMALKVNLNMPC